MAFALMGVVFAVISITQAQRLSLVPGAITFDSVSACERYTRPCSANAENYPCLEGSQTIGTSSCTYSENYLTKRGYQRICCHQEMRLPTTCTILI